MQDGCRNENINQLFESLLLEILLIVSNEVRFLTILHAMKQLVKWSCYASKIIDKTLVKVAKFNKDLNILISL